MDKSLDSARILRIFEILGYQLAETEVGTAVVMNPQNAFVFSVVTGASYLDDDQFPFTVKGLTKLFNSVFSSEPIWGLFDGGSLGYTPKNILKKRPFVLDGPKYVVPVDIDSESAARQWVELSRRKLKDPEHFMFFRVETWKSGNGMEPLLEYLATHRFREMGYLVETQVPLTAAAGSPDFLALRDDHLFQTLINYRGNNSLGGHIIELAMFFDQVSDLPPWPRDPVGSFPSSILTIIGEAKVGGSNPKPQLEKYMSTKYFNQKIALLDRLPGKGRSPEPSFAITSENETVITDIDLSIKTSLDSYQKRYLDWYHFVAKCYLLVNFDPDLIFLLGRREGHTPSNSVTSEILNLAHLLDVEEIVKNLPARI